MSSNCNPLNQKLEKSENNIMSISKVTGFKKFPLDLKIKHYKVITYFDTPLLLHTSLFIGHILRHKGTNLTVL